VVTSEAVHSFELPPGEEINRLARRVYGLLSVRPTAQETAQYAEASATLSDAILKPAAHLLGGKRLLVVSDGALQYVPFAVLPEPEVANRDPARAESPRTDGEATPLVVRHEIVHLPSASVLALLREGMSGRAPAPGALAIIADPVFDADDYRVSKAGRRQEPGALAAKASEERTRGRGSFKVADPARTARAHRGAEAGMVRAARQVGLTGRGILPPLFFSRLEAETIYALVPPGEGMLALNFDASRATATDAALSRYRIIHFATHALLDEEHPELSGLVFSLVDEKGRPQNGSLPLREIYNLKLPAELVVLSACQTALGKEVKGEGLIGLTRGFMYAGAKGVLASLWQIDDKSTAELMQHFYRERLQENRSPAAALRAAQVAMWNQTEGRRRHPYYWGAFVLQGEWR
jgi:CHAT domain-containing protein